jgi:hypothetical protein
VDGRTDGWMHGWMDEWVAKEVDRDRNIAFPIWKWYYASEIVDSFSF